MRCIPESSRPNVLGSVSNPKSERITNFWEQFIFEPRLDPGLPEHQRAELELANIRLIYELGSYGSDSTPIYLLGHDGQVCRVED